MLERGLSLSQTSVGRISGLDGIRGLAILMVVTSHAGLGFLSSGGRVGVTLFFVLSGFLITRLLIVERTENGSINIAAFYGRRSLRLLPALLVYLIGIGLVVWWRRIDVPVWDMSWPPAMYIANYVQILGHDLYAHRHTWSLAVEEHFYLIWPLMVAAGAARRAKLLAVGVVTLLLWRFAAGLANPNWAYHASDTNAYALGLGCLIAVYHQRSSLPRLPTWSIGMGMSSLVLLGLAPLYLTQEAFPAMVWLPPLAAVAAAITIIGILQHDSVIMRSATLRWFGLISYSLYLWHAPLLQFPGMSETVGRRLVSVGLAIGVATASWVFVERPILHSSWRRRLSPASKSKHLLSLVRES
jgi:peptidoglycan/LPS O-acetylase OafA/YrhL